MKKLILIISFLIVCQSSIVSQSSYHLRGYIEYYDQQSFFFSPSKFFLSQLDVQKDIQNSFSSHFLSRLNVNPANLNRLSGKNYFYMDVRTSQKKALPQSRFIDYSTSLNSSYFDPVVRFSEKEPLFSIAFFINPLKRNPRFKSGITYQYLQVDDRYDSKNFSSYSIYQVLAESGRFDLDWWRNDLLNDIDFSKYRGHFISFFNSYELSKSINLGIKVGVTSFINLGNNMPANAGYVSFDPFSEFFSNRVASKKLEYKDWDISTGITIKNSENSIAGISIGFLNGNFNNDESQNVFSRNQTFLENDQSSLGHSNSEFRDIFERTGSTLYTNLDYLLEATSVSRVEFAYRTARTAQDINYGNQRLESSGYNNALYFDESINGYVNVDSDYDSKRQATGIGNNIIWNHAVSLKYDYDISKRVNLVTGIQLSLKKENENSTRIYQRVFNSKEITSNEENGILILGEANSGLTSNKILNDYYSRSLNTYIPIILSTKLLKTLSIQVGFIHSKANLKAGNEQVYRIYQEDVNTVNGVTTSIESNEDFESSNSVENKFSNWNSFGSITFSPNERMSFLLRGVSSDTFRGDDFNYGNGFLGSFNFSISAEVNF